MATYGSIQANNAINILTNPADGTGNAQVQLLGSMNLAMNLPQNSNPIVPYQSFPAINISGAAVTVATGAVISSQINASGTTPANIPNTITINTAHLTNNGSITGGAATSSPFSNAYIHVNGAGGPVLSIDGTGSFSVPGYSVIEFSALDNDKLLIGANSTLPTISTGAGSVLILNAQGSKGVVKFQPNQTLTVSGGPIISINSPSLYMSEASQINATGASVIAIGSGYSKSPLHITLAGTQEIKIATGSGGAIRMRPTDGHNLTISALDSATLNLSGAIGQIATSGTGTTINIPYNVLNPSMYLGYLNPAGGIIGGEFQPYVGGYFTSLTNNPGVSPKFVNFAGYTKGSVIAMLAPVAAEQQAQVLATYTQQYSASYVIGAAKQLGLRVSAGVFVDLAPDGTNIAPARTAFDSAWAISSAQKYGNVIDIVVGNEDIVATSSSIPDPSPSVNTLVAAITTVKGLTTLPVTTRQTIGVLTGDVTNYASMRTLLNTVEDHIYGNVYPFFYFDVNSGLTPGMSKTAFQDAVSKNMSSQFDAATTAFVNAKTAGTTPVTSMPVLRVGETGWATELLPVSSTGLGYAGSGLPLQSTQWAGWYYEAMQAWSATHTNATAPTGTTGTIIGGYFGLYDEPWKGIDGGNPANLATNLSGPASIGATSISINQTLTTLTPQSVLINPNNADQEVQNITSYGTSTLGVSALVNAHLSGEVVDAGHPEEPYFGLYSAQGVFPNNSANNVNDSGNGYIFTLTGITRKIPLPVYGTALPPVPQPPPPIVITTTPIDTSLNSNLLAASLAATASINSINNSLSSTPGIIVPTDINPELPSETSESSILSAINANNNPQLLQGNAQFTSPQFGINPAESLITFSANELLLAPDHPLSVNTNLANVQIDAGSAVMLLQNGNELAIFALHDDHSGAVRVMVDGQSMEIPVGRQLVLSRDHGAPFEKVNPTGIGYRNVSEGKLGSLKAYTSEFSVLSALTSTRALRPLLKSANKEERELVAKLLKTAAAMSMVGKNKVPFKASR